MPVTLDEILSTTRNALPGLKAQRPLLERQLADMGAVPPFAEALRRAHVAVIAEVKRRSPSAGTIRADLDPATRASRYAAAGAAAISVLTDGPFFGGSVADLRSAALTVRVPVLRKDFILDEIQIMEARAAGAAAVLLIVRAVPPARLGDLLRCAAELGLDALVEVHTADEARTALDVGARVIGVNSRDLDTFRIDTAAAWTLLRGLPSDVIAVAESGMGSVADVRLAADAGADAVLIGTALSAATTPDALLAELSGVPRHGR